MYAFTAASHARLGKSSPARVLSKPLMRRVGRFALEPTPVVIDSGSFRIRAGFAGDDAPREVFPPVDGLRKRSDDGAAAADGAGGDDAPSKRDEPRSPIEFGVVADWDAMEKVWHHVFFAALRTAPEEHPVLLTEKPLNPKAHRERTTRIMFETFGVPALYVCMQPVLALYESGRTSGVVLDSGHDGSTAVPVYEGYAMPHAIVSWSVGARDVMLWIRTLLGAPAERCAPGELELLARRHMYVALEFDAEAAAPPEVREVRVELRDGEVALALGTERFRGPEMLFEPHTRGPKSDKHVGLAQHVYTAIMRCDTDAPSRKECFADIVLTGGNTLWPGMAERLTKELTALAPPRMKVNVVAPPERHHSVWAGGSVLAALETFKAMWITKAEYDESGPAIVHSKCL